ncbi:MAG: hypothetical protein KAR42_04825 [candidate division Zixibacteria bacterium]|nr:hypothetical protein [candidate division Zixibacteria bacterium]
MSKVITMQDIERLSKESARVLYGSDSVDQPNNLAQSEPTMPSKNQMKDLNPNNLSSYTETDRINHRLMNALRIIKVQCDCDIPFLFRSEAASMAGIKGAATLIAAEKEALKANIIQVHNIALAKTKKLFWEILEQGYSLIKQEQPKWKSKGEYKHKLCVYRIAHTHNRHGYKTTIEYRRPNGKLVDLLSVKGEETIYTEICASYPIEKELINIEKNLSCEPMPTKMYLAVTDRKMKNPLNEAVHDFKKSFSLPCPVDVVLAGDLIGPLEETK